MDNTQTSTPLWPVVLAAVMFFFAGLAIAWGVEQNHNAQVQSRRQVAFLHREAVRSRKQVKLLHREVVQGQQAHRALCVLKKDYVKRARDGQKYLKQHPHLKSVIGLTRAQIEASVRAELKNVHALNRSGLRC